MWITAICELIVLSYDWGSKGVHREGGQKEKDNEREREREREVESEA